MNLDSIIYGTRCLRVPNYDKVRLAADKVQSCVERLFRLKRIADSDSEYSEAANLLLEDMVKERNG